MGEAKSHRFHIRFRDNGDDVEGGGLDVASLDDDDFIVGRVGTNEPIAVRFVTFEDGVATYEFEAPASWTSENAGEYEIVLSAGQVRDLSGNEAVARGDAVGTFDAAIYEGLLIVTDPGRFARSRYTSFGPSSRRTKPEGRTRSSSSYRTKTMSSHSRWKGVERLSSLVTSMCPVN